MSESYTLPITITVAALPPGDKFTPQQLADAIAARLQFVTATPFALFTIGDTEPSSDLGPWAQGGRVWKYFDEVTGQYQPFVIPPEGLQYSVSATEPTDTRINVWFEIDPNTGLPVDIRLRVDSETDPWPSVYYPKGDVYTKVETDAFVTAIEAQITAILTGLAETQRYCARANRGGTSQTVDISGASEKLTFDSEVIDTGDAFDLTDSRYTAPVAGIYRVSFTGQFDNAGGTASGMQIGVNILVNGGTNLLGATTAVPSPPGARWFVNCSGLVALSAGQYIECFMIASDGVNTGDLAFANASFCVDLVQQTA